MGFFNKWKRFFQCFWRSAFVMSVLKIKNRTASLSSKKMSFTPEIVTPAASVQVFEMRTDGDNIKVLGNGNNFPTLTLEFGKSYEFDCSSILQAQRMALRTGTPNSGTAPPGTTNGGGSGGRHQNSADPTIYFTPTSIGTAYYVNLQNPSTFFGTISII
jgi:hypothetical protein